MAKTQEAGSTRFHRPSLTRQRGVAAIAAAMLTISVAGLALGSFLLQSNKARQENAQGQEQAVLWANQAVMNFVAAHGRLPCPAMSSLGAEACGGLGKGWLPVGSLVQVQGRAPDAVKTMDIRYMIYKGAGESADPDFSSSEPTFVPALTDGAGVGDYRTDIESTMDLCGNLQGLGGDVNRWDLPGERPQSLWSFARGSNQFGQVAPAGSVGGAVRRADRAHVVLPEGITNVAFGIAVAAPGTSGGSSSGVNASAGVPRMESPIKPKGDGYSDIVSVTLPHELYNALSCDAAIAALDSVAVAQTWIDDALGFKKGNIRAGKAIGDIMMVNLVAAAKHIVHDTIDLINGVYNFADNLAKKAIAEASDFLLPFVPVHVSGMADAVAGQVLGAVDLARAVAGLAISAGYGAAYYKLASDAEATVIWEGGRSMLEQAHAQGWAMGAVAPLEDPAANEGSTP